MTKEDLMWIVGGLGGLLLLLVGLVIKGAIVLVNEIANKCETRFKSHKEQIESAFQEHRKTVQEKLDGVKDESQREDRRLSDSLDRQDNLRREQIKNIHQELNRLLILVTGNPTRKEFQESLKALWSAISKGGSK